MNELHKIYQAKCFVGSSISKRDETLHASDQRDSRGCASPHHFSIFIFLWLSLANISVQYNLFRTRSRPMDTQSAIFLFLKENVCSGYPLEAAFSNVNDSFTFSRLMMSDELYNLRFFVKYTETLFQPCLCLFDVELLFYSNG